MKRVGVVYCLMCGCETEEVDGVCDGCLEQLSGDWGEVLGRGEEKPLRVQDR